MPSARLPAPSRMFRHDIEICTMAQKLPPSSPRHIAPSSKYACRCFRAPEDNAPFDEANTCHFFTSSTGSRWLSPAARRYADARAPEAIFDERDIPKRRYFNAAAAAAASKLFCAGERFSAVLSWSSPRSVTPHLRRRSARHDAPRAFD